MPCRKITRGFARAMALLAVAGPAALSARGAHAQGAHERASAPSAASRQFTTTGVVASFGPGRAYVNITHADIAGFMRSMTMSFRPRDTAQIAALAPGDAVRFQFTVDSEGQRYLDSITRAPR